MEDENKKNIGSIHYSHENNKESSDSMEKISDDTSKSNNAGNNVDESYRNKEQKNAESQDSGDSSRVSEGNSIKGAAQEYPEHKKHGHEHAIQENTKSHHSEKPKLKTSTDSHKKHEKNLHGHKATKGIAVKKTAKKDDDEISMDLSGIKNFFKKAPEKEKTIQEKRKNEDNEISLKLDSQKIKKILSSKAFGIIAIAILVLIPLVISFSFRAYPAHLPVADKMAENAIHNSIKNSIKSEVLSQYPTLGGEALEKEINSRYNNMLKTYGDEIDKQIELQAKYFRDEFQYDDGQTYMSSIDPYHFYKLGLNLLENGHPGTELKDGVPFDMLMIAPKGKSTPKADFHIYLQVWTYKVMDFFDNDVTFYKAVFWVPIFAILAVIPVFFIVRRKAGNLGALVAGIVVGAHQVYLSRTLVGAPDTDPYPVVFGLLVTWMFFESFYTEKLWKKAILTGIAGFFVGVFSWAWTGWWFIFNFIIAVFAVYIGYEIIKSILKKRKIKDIATNRAILTSIGMVLFFIISSFVFIAAFRGSTNTLEITKTAFGEGAMSFINIQSAIAMHGQPQLWPNVGTTVAELNTVSLGGVIKQLGETIFFVIAALGIVFTLVPKKLKSKHIWLLIGSLLWFGILASNRFYSLGTVKFLMLFSIPVIAGVYMNLKAPESEEVNIKVSLLLTLWFMATIYAGTQGVRFVMILIPAFAIALGIALGSIYSIFSAMAAKELKISQTWPKVIMAVLILILIGAIPSFGLAGDCPFWPEKGMVCKGHYTAMSDLPLVNDAWVSVLTTIKEETPEDTIITSWWDFGHWFKALAERRVTFDGASQMTPMAHWVGKALLTDNEQETIAILRMLDCGSNDAFDIIDEKLYDRLEAVRLTKEIIMLNREAAKEKLAVSGFNEKEINMILEKSHCENPPNAVFITSGDMVGKAGVWAHFGSWNFDRAYQYKAVKSSIGFDKAVADFQERFGMTKDEATKRYYDVIALQSEREANDWIAQWPGYVIGSERNCKVGDVNITDDSNLTVTTTGKKEITCFFNKIISTQDNNNIVLEAVVVNPEEPENVKVVFGFYDKTTGARRGAANSKPAAIAIADNSEKMRVYDIEGFDFWYAILIIPKDDGTYGSLVMDRALLESTFTKLFYLDGKYTSHFTKLVEKTSMSEDRIIAWNVVW